MRKWNADDDWKDVPSRCVDEFSHPLLECQRLTYMCVLMKLCSTPLDGVVGGNGDDCENDALFHLNLHTQFIYTKKRVHPIDKNAAQRNIDVDKLNTTLQVGWNPKIVSHWYISKMFTACIRSFPDMIWPSWTQLHSRDHRRWQCRWPNAMEQSDRTSEPTGIISSVSALTLWLSLTAFAMEWRILYGETYTHTHTHNQQMCTRRSGENDVCIA